MPTPAALPQIVDGLKADLGRLAERQTSGQLSPAQWHNAALRELGDYHTAAYLAGAAERLGIREGSALLNTRNLSKAEKSDIRAALAKQTPYLNSLTDALEAGDISDAALLARSQAYAGSIKSTYWHAKTSSDLPFQPSEDCECSNNCQCSWQERDGDWWWRLGSVATQHCPTCLRRADDSPYTVTNGELQ